MSVILGACNPSLSALRILYERADRYVADFSRRWQQASLDALVCPAFPFAAVPHEYPQKLLAAALSAGMWNLLDFPAGIVPM